MRRIDLTHCTLSWSVLAGANLTEANFGFSNLRGANLSYAMLVGALFTDVDLRGANLRHAELSMAVLNGVQLAEGDLAHAHLSKSVITRCRDLHQALGLDRLDYLSPSSVDLETLRHCMPGLEDELLQGLGLEPPEIDELRDLFGAGRGATR
jgi:uncharacterized protein YjbI with pentapeptide repeats